MEEHLHQEKNSLGLPDQMSSFLAASPFQVQDWSQAVTDTTCVSALLLHCFQGLYRAGNLGDL